MHKTDILWAQPSNGGVADQFSKSSPKLHKIFILLLDYYIKFKKGTLKSSAAGSSGCFF